MSSEDNKCDKCGKTVKRSEAKTKGNHIYEDYYCLPCYDKLFGEEERENERKEQEKHQKEYGCSECGQVGKDPKTQMAVCYHVEIGDELERKHDKSQKLKLCPDCWSKKKESYKSLITKKDNGLSFERKIIVIKWKENQGGGNAIRVDNCLTCKKWDDEYEVKGVFNYCSIECEKNKDKGNDPKRERERRKLLPWNYALRS